MKHADIVASRKKEKEQNRIFREARLNSLSDDERLKQAERLWRKAKKLKLRAEHKALKSNPALVGENGRKIYEAAQRSASSTDTTPSPARGGARPLKHKSSKAKMRKAQNRVAFQ
jgi:hypothetical protein